MGEIKTGHIDPLLIKASGDLSKLKKDNANKIIAFLAEVSFKREIPLHTTVAWNALAFAYSVDNGGYLATMPKNERQPGAPLPIGTILYYKKSGKEIYAEVVGKQGMEGEESESVQLSPSYTQYLKDLRSNTPAKVKEKLILDFNPLADNYPTEHDLTVLNRISKKLTEERHLEIETVYTHESELDDIAMYAKLLAESKQINPLATVMQDNSLRLSVNETFELLMSGMVTLRELLIESGEFISLGGYHFSRRLKERDDKIPLDLPYNKDEIDRMARGALHAQPSGAALLIEDYLRHDARTSKEYERLSLHGCNYL